MSLYEDNFVASFRTMQNAVHKNAVEHGWWDEERSEGELIALEHSELSEALEAMRQGNPPDDKCSDYSSVEIELADAIIRIMDHAEKHGYRLAQAIIAKHEFNRTRPYRHGGKAF